MMTTIRSALPPANPTPQELSETTASTRRNGPSINLAEDAARPEQAAHAPARLAPINGRVTQHLLLRQYHEREAQADNASPLARRSQEFHVNEDEQLALSLIQSVMRGYLARKQVRVRTLAEGIVHVQIKGDARLLARLGIEGITTPGPKSIDYLAIDPARFDAQLAGGTEIVSASADKALPALRSLLGRSEASRANYHAMINGGFYNVSRKAGPEHPVHAAIGASLIPGVDLPEHLPVPQGYEDVYTSIRFPNGSVLTTGPELCRDDKLSFDRSRLDEPRFQWHDGRGFVPGMLRHADHPNTRSAAIFPGRFEEGGNTSGRTAQSATEENRQDRFRILVARVTNDKLGAERNGLDLAELAVVARKLAQHNATPGGRGINLDGGQSSQLTVFKRTMGPYRVKIMNIAQQQLGNPSAANYIVFSAKTPQE